MGKIGVPWEFAIRNALRQGEAELPQIYDEIENTLKVLSRQDSEWELIRTRLIREDPRWQHRPMYQHTVRGMISYWKRRGLVELVTRRVYRLTEAGHHRLHEYDIKHDTA
jgi:hypothetical protein